MRNARLLEYSLELQQKVPDWLGVFHLSESPKGLDSIAENRRPTGVRLRPSLVFHQCPGLPARTDGSRVLTWPNVTILPFLADPSNHMVLKPQITRRLARRMPFDLLYSASLSWHTYEALMRLSESLLDRLAPLEAKDYIDVQSFVWVTTHLD